MDEKYMLTDKDINNILKKKNKGVHISCDADIQFKKETYGSHEIVSSTERNRKYKFICFCEKSKGIAQDGRVCKHCGNGLYKNPGAYIKAGLISRKCTEAMKEAGVENNKDAIKIAKTYKENKKSIFSGFYVKKHPIEEAGILIFKIQIYITIEEDMSYETSCKTEYITEIVPGKGNRSYKILRKELVPEDAFIALNLNSNTKKYDVNVVYDNADNLIDFCLKNRKFSNYTAFLEMHNNLSIPIPKNSFFLLYAYIYAQYPVVEFLAKMKYFTLLKTMIEKIMNSPNKVEMQMEAERLQKLFNNNTTKGSMALNMPKYVADYLDGAQAPYNVFLRMCELYQVNNFSKEDFEKLITHEDAEEFLKEWEFPRFINTVKFGYKLKKLLDYIDKHKSQEYSAQQVLTTLRDYNSMLELMGADNVDKYPADPVKAHDHVVSIYSANKNEIEIKALSSLSEYITNNVHIENDKYVMIVPSTAKDFVNEGQAQHNCVEHYYKKMANHQTIIFFIRKKENPLESFVTAEYTQGHIPQLMFKYNKPVNDKDIVTFAQKIAEKLQKLPKLKNI